MDKAVRFNTRSGISNEERVLKYIGKKSTEHGVPGSLRSALYTLDRWCVRQIAYADHAVSSILAPIPARLRYISS